MPGRHPDAYVDMLLDTVYGGEPGEAVQAPGPTSSVASNPAPPPWDVRQVFNVKSPSNPSGVAVSDGVTDAFASINAGITAAMPSGGVCYVPAGLDANGNPAAYMFSAPLVVAPPNSDTTAQLASSLVCPSSGGRIGDNIGDPSVVLFKPLASFPSGQWLVDYRNKVNNPAANTALLGAVVGGFSVDCRQPSTAVLSAGVRIASPRRFDVYNINCDHSILPAPTVAKSSQAASFMTDDFTGTETAYNTFRNISNWAAAFDGFQATIGQSMFFGVYGGGHARYAITWGNGSGYISQTSLIGGDDDVSQNTFAAQSHTQQMHILGFTSWPPGGPKNNCVYSQGANPAITKVSVDEFVGCDFIGTSTAAQGEAASAMIRATAVVGTLTGLRFTACNFSAGSQTSRWVYATATVTGVLDIADSHFDSSVNAPLSGNFNQNGANILRVANCTGLNPLAGVTTPGFPATTVAVANTTGVDVDAYITNGVGALTVQVDSDTALAILPASQVMVVPIPARSTFTPTYGSGAPAWKWKGR